MARIDVLPSIEIIRGLKGILDFYVWRGLPCVRAWPRYRPARQTDASLAAALTFGAIVKAYALLANLVLLAYRQDALDQPRTARDIMVTGVYGNLHEASMSDFLDAIIIIRDAVVSLTDLLHTLDSIDTDEIVVNVDQSVLPPLAATTTNQASMIAALQKIDDLQDALESKALDRLLVRGMNQLFSFASPLTDARTAAISGASGWIESSTVPAGQVWVISNIELVDITSATTWHFYAVRAAAVDHYFHDDKRAIAASESTFYRGQIWLQPGYVIRCTLVGALLADSCRVTLTGHIMTKET